MGAVETRGSGTFVRYLLIFFNFLFVLGASALLVVSVWALADERTLRPFIKTRLFTALSLAALGVAVTALCVALLGCCGAAKRAKCILVLFAVLLIFFLLATLAGVVTLYVFRGVVQRQIKAGLVASLKYDYVEDPPTHEFGAIKDSWDWLQQTLGCCGVADKDGSAAYYSWQSSRWFRDAANCSHSPCEKNVVDAVGLVPDSCCVPSAPGVVVDKTNNSTFLNRDKCRAVKAFADFRGPPRLRTAGGFNGGANDALYVEGCFSVFLRLVAEQRNLVIIVSAVVALIAVQVAGVGLACHLCRRLRSRGQLQMEDFSKGRWK